MRIGIIGAGSVGAVLGQAWGASGHAIRYGLRKPDDPKYANLGPERLTTPPEAVASAEAVVIATPWTMAIEAVKSLGNLGGKILIDCTNPVAMGPDGLSLAIDHATSAGELIAAAAPGAAVFKTLNQTGAENMAKAKSFNPKAVMYVAGDDEVMKPVVMGLIQDLGFESVDAGPLRNARLLEALAMLWIDQALKRGRGRDFAFALTRRQ